jgi:hypothetical protein
MGQPEHSVLGEMEEMKYPQIKRDPVLQQRDRPVVV